MRFSGYFSLRYFFDSFLSWLIENRNAVFMRFIGCFSLRYLLFFMSVYPILEVNNSWFSSCSLTSRSFLTAALVPGSAALYASCISFVFNPVSSSSDNANFSHIIINCSIVGLLCPFFQSVNGDFFNPSISAISVPFILFFLKYSNNFFIISVIISFLYNAKI